MACDAETILEKKKVEKKKLGIQHLTGNHSRHHGKRFPVQKGGDCKCAVRRWFIPPFLQCTEPRVQFVTSNKHIVRNTSIYTGPTIDCEIKLVYT